MSHDPRPGTDPFRTVPASPLSPGDERLWATVAHLSIPFFGFVGPTIAWFGFADRSAWLRESVVEALNFSILYTITQVVCALLVVILLGVVLVPLVGLAAVIVCILATMAAQRGEQYRYPVNLRIVR